MRELCCIVYISGCAVVTLGTLQETDRLRIPLKGNNNLTVGFLSLVVWSLEREDHNASTDSTPLRTVTHHDTSVSDLIVCVLHHILSFFTQIKYNNL